MKAVQALLMTGLLLASAALWADDSDWLGDINGLNSIGLRLGQDNASAQLLGVDATLTLPAYTQLSLAVSRSSSRNEFNLERYNVAFSSDPFATWYGRLSYQQAGNKQLLETEDTQLTLGYFPGDWRLEIGVIDRDITTYFNPAIVRQGLLGSSSINLHSEGVSLMVEYYFTRWSVAVAGQAMDYQQDLAAVQTNRRLQRLLSEQTLSQMSTFTEWQADITLQYQRSATTRLGGGFIRYKAIVGGKLDSTLFVSLDRALSENINLLLLLARSTADALNYGELGLVYSW